MDFYRTTISSIHARIANSLKAAHVQSGCLIPTTSRICCKTPSLSDNLARMSERLLSLLIPHYCFAFYSVLSTVFSLRRNNSSSTAAAPPPRRSNYACLVRKISLFRTFAAVVKSPVARCAARILAAQPSPIAETNHLYCTGFAFTHHSSLITRNFLPPTLWRDWQKSATKHLIRHKIGEILPCCRRVRPFCHCRRCRHNNKSKPISRCAFVSFSSQKLMTCVVFTLHFVLTNS
jgi:hypothetical protein